MRERDRETERETKGKRYRALESNIGTYWEREERETDDERHER